jgi:hypothetical protein
MFRSYIAVQSPDTHHRLHAHESAKKKITGTIWECKRPTQDEALVTGRSLDVLVVHLIKEVIPDS